MFLRRNITSVTGQLLDLNRKSRKSQKLNNQENKDQIMATIGKWTNYLSASVSINRHTLYKFEWLLSAGVHSNLVVSTFFPKQWDVDRQSAGNGHLRTAFKDSFHFIGKIDLHVRIVYSSTETIFRIVNRQVFNILLGASFIDENIIGYVHNQREWYYVTLRPFQYSPRT